MFTLVIDEKLKKKLTKVTKKYPKFAEIVIKKAKEIVKNPDHYKNLKSPLQNYKRVHVDRHFVLIFSVDGEKKTVTLEELDNHDKVYL